MTFRPWLVAGSTFIFGSSLALSLAYVIIWRNEKKHKSKSNGALATKRTVPPGLPNFGNTCFANALLQALASGTTFVDWLFGLPQSSKDSNFLDELRLVLQELHSADSTGPQSAERLVNVLFEHRWLISQVEQQDLLELFNVFVTTWEEELEAIRKKEQILLLNINRIANAQCVSPRTSESLLPVNEFINFESKLRPPCAGSLATQFLCTRCYHKRVRHDRFCVLSLAIPKTTALPYITLECCLKKYLSSEIIKNASCDRCREKDDTIRGDLVKKQGLSKLPPCLIMRVERMSYLPDGHSFKHSDFIQFPEIFDVGSYCFYKSNVDLYANSSVLGGKVALPLGPSLGNIGPLLNSNLGLTQSAVISGGSHVLDKVGFAREMRYKYRLSAVVVHSGSPEYGHFVTYRRGMDSDCTKWYFTSDNCVRRVPLSQVLDAQAYMLFYERLAR